MYVCMYVCVCVCESGLLAVVCYWLKISCVWEGRCVIQASRVLNEDSPIPTSADDTQPKVPEVPEAFNLFCGTQWRNAYALVFYVSFLSCAWVLAILFAHTMSSSMPFVYHPEETCTSHDGETISDICNTRYMINIALLAAFTTPLALMDVKEQWYVQNSLAFIRVCRMLLMCITPMLVGAIGDSPEMRSSFPGSFVSDTPSSPPPFLVGNLFGLSQVLSAAVFSQFLNGSIPIIIDSLKNRDNYIKVLNITFTTCFCLYVWLSIVVSTQFGSTTANPCNLNWVGYRWPSEDGSCERGSFCDLSARLVEFIIVFCPAIDVVSAYPFLAIILGNSFTEMVLGANTDSTESNDGEEDSLLHSNQTSSRGSSEMQASDSWFSYKVYNKLFRFAMNILPMILAVTIENFSTVIQLTGAISVLICLVFPPLLSIKCNAYLSEKYATFCNHILSPFTHLSWVDGNYSTSHLEKNSNLKNYGTADGNNPRQVAPVIPFVSDEFIENETFKWMFLSIGICITSVIFYISTR
jgi:hypothetical protein